MNDFPDLTPPPERPLSPEQRARLRSRLPRPEDDRNRSWLVPTVAAAAVVALVAGGSVVLARSVGGDDGAPSTVQPATGATSPAPPPPSVTASTDPCAAYDAVEQSIAQSTKELEAVVTGAPSTCLPTRPPATCAHEVHDALPGAILVAGSADGVGFWQAGPRWTLCAHDASRTTVHRVQDLDSPPVGNAWYAFSTDHGDLVAGHMPTTFVAGDRWEAVTPGSATPSPTGTCRRRRISTEPAAAGGG